MARTIAPERKLLKEPPFLIEQPYTANHPGAGDRSPGARIAHRPERLMDRIFESGGATLHSFGPIEGSGTKVKVGYSYYCGGLCASGGTQIVELVEGEWEVTGSEGPVWIS